MEEKIWTWEELFLIPLKERNGRFKLENGKIGWLKEGMAHRLDGPALESPNGDKYYFIYANEFDKKDWEKISVLILNNSTCTYTSVSVNCHINNGKFHREDGPAVEYANGKKYWYKEGIRHREDGPAIEYASGYKEWHKEGKIHREDGPAIEFANGTKNWFKEGKYHREDGPACEYHNGGKSWYLEGKKYTEEEYIVKMTENKIYTKEEFDELPVEKRTGCVKSPCGTKEWFKEDKLHREDGPAVELPNGTKAWFKEDLLHREDGPAHESANGYKSWYLEGKKYTEEEYNIKVSKNKIYTLEEFDKIPKEGRTGYFELINGNKYWYKEGKLHREDGPAVEFANGTKIWFKEGKYHREDGPAVEYTDGDKQWFIEGKLHREDGPAMESSNGAKSWYKEGKLHRDDGPAIEYYNGKKEWYLEGKKYTEEEYNIKINALNEKLYTNTEVNTLIQKEKLTGKFKFYDGKTIFFKDGLVHREDGPAIITCYTDYYFIENKKYTKKEFDLWRINNDSKVNEMKNVKEPGFMDMVKSDAEKAAYRVAATQMSNGVKKGLIKILESKGLEGSKSEAAAEMLNTEIGSAMVALLLGYGLKYAPMISEDARAVKLSEEFRVKGMETVGNEIVGSLMEHLLPEVMNILGNLPEVKVSDKIRIVHNDVTDDIEEIEESKPTKRRGKLSAVANEK